MRKRTKGMEEKHLRVILFLLISQSRQSASVNCVMFKFANAEIRCQNSLFPAAAIHNFLMTLCISYHVTYIYSVVEHKVLMKVAYLLTMQHFLISVSLLGH